MLNTKRMRFPLEIILVCIRWYYGYPLSLRHLEEMMEERGAFLDHSTVGRWAIKFGLALEKIFRRYKSPVGRSWRMDETYVKINGKWTYLYRAVDKEGQTIDFLLRAKRDKVAAKSFFDKAMRQHGIPEKVTMDKSGSNKSAIDSINARQETPIEVRQIKYLNNIVEQDHRFIKRVIKPMLGFKSFRSARSILAGIEVTHMIRKGQCLLREGGLSAADQFYAMAGLFRQKIA